MTGILTPNDEGTEICIGDAVPISQPWRGSSPRMVLCECLEPESDPNEAPLSVKPPRGGIALFAGSLYSSAPDYPMLEQGWDPREKRGAKMKA